MQVNKLSFYIDILLSLILGIFFMHYMRITNLPFVWLGISVLMYFLISKNKDIPISKGKERVVSIIFSAVFALSIICGSHIRVDVNKSGFSSLMETLYFGNMKYVYITKYSFMDVIAYIIMFIIIIMTFRLINHSMKNAKFIKKIDYKYCEKIGIWKKKNWLIVAGILFICWLPYLCYYYPGLIASDSLHSMEQIFGYQELSNNHPILYTCFIKLCVKIGMSIKDLALGCCIYTVIQMIYIALALGYMIMWIRKKGTPKFICILCVIYFGLTPYYAQNSIIMWKDPIFSVTIMLLSLWLFDMILSEGKLFEKNSYYLKYIWYVFMVCFWRNNGLYVMLVCEAIFILYAIIKKNKHFKSLSIKTAVMLLIIWIITGPLYSAYGLSGKSVESYGIGLNQMARVVASNGKMSKEDKEFMNELMKLEYYEELYTPGCVDSIKTDWRFRNYYLNKNVDKFKDTYMSLLIKNPKLYFESWQLNTFGFWAVNQWEINYYDDNVKIGKLKDIYTYRDSKDDKSYEDTEDMTKESKKIGLFRISYKGRNISLAILTWVIILIACIVVIKRWELVVALAPILGVIATIMVAVPIAYLPRYGLAECYLMPFYFIVFMFSMKKSEVE